MTDAQRLDIALCKIVTESETCATCAFRHYIENDYCAICFFACDCIANKHKHYQKNDPS